MRPTCGLFNEACRSGVKEDHTANYFSHGNEHATKLRDQLANESLDMLIQWLKDGGNVGIHGTRPYICSGRHSHPLSQMQRIVRLTEGECPAR